MIHLLRANHANEFELQNYKGIKDLHVITSHHPLTDISLPSTKLWSPTDLPRFPFRRQLLNRLIGGEQWLLGLESIIHSHSVESIQRNVIHTAETYTPYTHQAVQLRKQGKISKLVCTCWETIPGNNEKFARLRKWKSEAYKCVDLFHTSTRRAKDALIAEGVDPKKIIVIPYGVDLNRFQPTSLQGESLKGKRCVVLTVARLEKEKGMEDLEIVAQSLPQYDFLVVGQGTYNPRGSNIKITSVLYSQIHKIYQKADIFFLPSRTTSNWEEQYGMSLVEAMACGLPIIASNSGAIPEVVGNAGITHQVCDVDKMVKTINDLLANPDQIRKHSKRSLARAKRLYDSRKVAIKLAKLYC
ncbi:hypothetical protein COT87_00935 [Candidatus Collierbacteria bacterium CG10_big_fil_rev_8_21_14_0_10_44_9]|uniref:Glycosyl transferase family 1 domain-containing protein n=1 Tax=Candidatus Collierbacteria bacterium CG10_big_fil_rev_8_21_14_0_10_44_9 TaxID=1974535 RepID=A0A2H0VJ82_9BACT|nr:MAG: hypothetical protein COT87_00935 [Candidatus Collierbacteria bacterium CG10_big_fil_rev_8_21_14_0_10_44_9]